MAREMVTCTRCGKSASKYDKMIRVEKNNRGGRPSYLCEDCNTLMLSYFFEHNELRGADTVHPFTYGMELETWRSNAKARSELAEYHFMPTSDSTVDVEYKSPIMNNLKSLAHLGKVLDRMLADGDIVIDDHCGTHFHVGHSELNAETMDYIRRFYNSLFVPLCEAMQAHPEETEELFGRNFGYWSDVINMNSSATRHQNFINTEHSNTLEFRIAFFRNGAQYMRVAKLATKIVDCVMTNFVEHFDDEVDAKKLKRNWKLNFQEEIDVNERNAQKMYRLFKAKMTGRKCAEIFLKAI